jgi:hypothetical protein
MAKREMEEKRKREEIERLRNEDKLVVYRPDMPYEEWMQPWRGRTRAST